MNDEEENRKISEYQSTKTQALKHVRYNAKNLHRENQQKFTPETSGTITVPTIRAPNLLVTRTFPGPRQHFFRTLPYASDV